MLGLYQECYKNNLMRILWIINSPLPEALDYLNNSSNEKKSSGGWLVAASDALSQVRDVELFVASSSNMVDSLIEFKGERIIHEVIPSVKGKDNIILQSKYWKALKSSINPDVIHIHGTEYLHGISYLNACGSDNVVLSVQGLVSEISKFYYAGLKPLAIIRNMTFYNLFRRTSIIHQAKRMKAQGEIEKRIIKSVDNVIGRTFWDKSIVRSINPNITYHHCNELLRSAFYSGKWSYKDCQKHSIFISQASYPVKGLHILLEALYRVRKHYPSAMLRIAGPNILKRGSLYDRLKKDGYSKIIKALIKKYGLQSAIKFLGPLNAEQMKREYLKSNVFVSPSSIENSPNSLGEAQILGVPCIASYVGGVPDFIPNINCGYMYRFEDVDVLTEQICDVFIKSAKFDNRIMREVALKRHDSEQNTLEMVKIYKTIMNHD